MNGKTRRVSKLRRIVPNASTCPTTDPNTTIGAATRGSIDQAHTPIATRPNAKPERPCTNPARHVPSTIDATSSAFIQGSVGGPAAINQEPLSSHIGRRVGGKEHSRADHVP